MYFTLFPLSSLLEYKAKIFVLFTDQSQVIRTILGIELHTQKNLHNELGEENNHHFD